MGIPLRPGTAFPHGALNTMSRDTVNSHSFAVPTATVSFSTYRGIKHMRSYRSVDTWNAPYGTSYSSTVSPNYNYNIICCLFSVAWPCYDPLYLQFGTSVTTLYRLNQSNLHSYRKCYLNDHWPTNTSSLPPNHANANLRLSMSPGNLIFFPLFTERNLIQSISDCSLYSRRTRSTDPTRHRESWKPVKCTRCSPWKSECAMLHLSYRLRTTRRSSFRLWRQFSAQNASLWARLPREYR